MPRTPHYIPGESTKKKCSKCGEWKPLSEYHANGYLEGGMKRYKSRCKECSNAVAQKKTPYPASPCARCSELELCQAILWDLIPLPCQAENFSMRRAAAWTEVVR